MLNTKYLKLLIKYCCFIAISISFWTIVLISTTIFFIYRKIIDQYLQFKYVKNYGGLFSTADKIFFDSPTPIEILIVIYARCKQEVNLLEFMTNLFQNKVFDNPDAYPKLTGSKHSFGGYPFWIKNDRHVSDAVKPLILSENVVFDDEYLQKVIVRIKKESHVKNDGSLWDVHVSDKPLENNENQDGVVYPIILRFHHAIADGTSLIALLIDLLGDKSTVNYSKKLIKKHQSKIRNKENSISSKLTTVIYLIFSIVFLSIGKYIHNMYSKHADNSLQKEYRDGGDLFIWMSEELPVALNMIQRIKARTRSSFSCIMCTAISASITDYFKRNELPVPNRIGGILAALVSLPNYDRSKSARLDNKTSVYLLDMPTVDQTKNATKALERVTNDLKSQLVYSDLLVMHLILHYVAGLIPFKILPQALAIKAPTFLLTNVPGTSRIHLFDGCVIEKLIPVVPLAPNCAATFAILSYDDRMQFNLTINENAIKSRKEAQKLFEGIFYYLTKIDKETQALYGNR